MEAQVERYAPGFRDLILARHVMGPADLEARNRNLVGGDVGGGSYQLRQVVFRPLPSVNPYSTPLDGLYLGRAAAFPGGAVHGVPRDAAARAALRASSRLTVSFTVLVETAPAALVTVSFTVSFSRLPLRSFLTS